MRCGNSRKKLDDLARIFNSQEIVNPDIRILFWGFFKVPFWDNAKVSLSSSWVLYWQPRSRAVLKVADRSFSPREDKIYLFPPHTLFSGYSNSPFIQFYVCFSVGSRFTAVKNEMLELPAAEILPLILRTAEQKGKVMQSVMLHCVIARVLSEIPEDAFLPAERVFMDKRIHKAVTLVEKNPDRCFSVQELCEYAKMSPNNFYRKFVAELGGSPQSWLQKKRLKQARELLMNTSMTIDEIALAAGFADRYQFSKAFKKIFLFPPVTYRKRMIKSGFMSDVPESQMNKMQKHPVISEEVSADNSFIHEKLNFAKKLLSHSTLSLEEIVLATGFRDSYQFSRIFKKYYQISPVVFRAENRKRKGGRGKP